MNKKLRLLSQQVSKQLRNFRLFLLTLLLCGYMQTMAETWTDSNGMTWTFTVSGTEATDIRPAMYEKTYLYGGPDHPEQGPVTLESGNALDGRFNGLEGKYFPTISDEVYYGFKTLIFEITETTEGPHIWNSEEVGTTMRVMNGWWSTVYADDVPMSVGLWELPITIAIANDCAKGGLGYDLDLMMTSGTVTIKSVYYQTSKIPDDVVIPAKVYAGSTELTVTSIGDKAFVNCYNLTSIDIPESVTSFGDNAFEGCFNLTNINFPESLTSLGDNTFSRCTSLADVNFPNSVTFIGEGTFYNCNGLTVVTIPNTVTSIGDEAFRYCSGMTSMTIPNSVTSIGNNAFYNCNSMTSVTIPNSVTSIGEGAFIYCFSLTKVCSLINDPFEIDSSVFLSHDSSTGLSDFTTATLYVPAGTKEKYEATAGWNLFKNIVEMEIVPVDEGQPIDIGTEIDEDTDLDGNVVGDIYYSISSGDGNYNVAEGCLEVTKPTDDSAIEGKDVFGEDFKDNYTGIVFLVYAGKGTIKVEAETQGNMVLKVKIGNSEPIEMELDSKLKVEFPYNVSEPTYVYIYGGMGAAGAKVTGGTRASSDADLLKIYSFEVVSDASGIDAIENGQPADADAPVYNLNGQRVNTPGKGIYIKNGRKVIMK